METDVIMKIAENYGVIPLLIFVIVRQHFQGQVLKELKQDVRDIRNKECKSACDVVPLVKKEVAK